MSWGVFFIDFASGRASFLSSAPVGLAPLFSAGFQPVTVNLCDIVDQPQDGYAVDINNPDLLINFHLKTEEKTRTSPPVYYGGYYGYRSGVYMGWPGYVEPGHIDTYTEGTLSIDLVNRRTNQMVWEGTAVARVTDTSMANTDQAVREAVGAIFAQYPFVAGSGVRSH